MCAGYEFSQPPGSYVETCTSFYLFSGPRWLTSWVGYWTPPKRTIVHPFPIVQCSHPGTITFLRHTTGNDNVTWFGAIHLVRQAPVPFLNNAKLLILLCWCPVAIKACINCLKHVVMIQKVTWIDCQTLSTWHAATCATLMPNPCLRASRLLDPGGDVLILVFFTSDCG